MAVPGCSDGSLRSHPSGLVHQQGADDEIDQEGVGQRVIAEDVEHSHSEDRYYCFGEVNGGILTVRFTFRDGLIRIYGAGYWRKGKAIYERENKVHR